MSVHSGQEKIWEYFQNEGVESFSHSQGRIEYLIRHLNKDVRTLNIGVGGGLLEELAIKKGVDMWSLDPSRQAIERLITRLNMTDKAQVGYSNAMPFPDGYFDVVVMSEVLEHLDEHSLEATMGEVSRVLRKRGEFIGTVPARENLADSLVVCPECGLKFHRWGHKLSFDIEGLYNQLSRRFLVIEISEHFFVHWDSAGFIERIKGLFKKFLSWRGYGTYGVYRNIFFIVKNS